MHPSQAKYHVQWHSRYVSKHGSRWSGYLRVMIVQQRPHPCGGSEGRADPRLQPSCAACVVPGYRLLPLLALLAVARDMYPVLAPASLVPPLPTCARQLLYPLQEPRGATGHAACRHGAWGHEWDEGRAPGLSQQKKEHAASLSFAQSLTV